MSRPDLPPDSRWTTPAKAGRPREEQPYRECPNCGRFRFRWLYAPGGLFTSETAYEICDECKYRRDRD